MTKYEIMTDRFEFRMGCEKWRVPAMSADEIFDTYMSGDTRITTNSLDPALAETFDDEDAARAHFAEHYADYGRTYLERGQVEYLLRGDLAYLQASVYDEDGEFIQDDGILAVSAAPYEQEA